jgi:hypothetical protein
MGLIKWKPNKMLNGKEYRYGDLYDTWHPIQQAHFDGSFDIYAGIVSNGVLYPSVAEQWKADFARKVKRGN